MLPCACGFCTLQRHKATLYVSEDAAIRRSSLPFSPLDCTKCFGKVSLTKDEDECWHKPCAHTHTHTKVHEGIGVGACKHRHTNIYTHIYTCDADTLLHPHKTQVHAPGACCILTYLHTSITHIHTYTYTYTRTYMHRRAYVHLHTYTPT